MKKFYKGFDKAANSLHEAIMNDCGRGYDSKCVTDWVESQEEAYMSKDYDWERIHTLIWKLKNSALIVFLHRLNVEENDECWTYDSKNKTLKQYVKGIEKETDVRTYNINRDIFDVWLNFAKNDEEREAITELKELFDKDLDKDRCYWAYERASDDFGCFYHSDINKKNDEEVAQFFNIPNEIEAYELDNGEVIDANDVVGECSSCSNVFSKNQLFSYNEKLERMRECDKESIGHCLNCDGDLFAGEITDKEVELVVCI